MTYPLSKQAIELAVTLPLRAVQVQYALDNGLNSIQITMIGKAAAVTGIPANDLLLAVIHHKRKH